MNITIGVAMELWRQPGAKALGTMRLRWRTRKRGRPLIRWKQPGKRIESSREGFGQRGSRETCASTPRNSTPAGPQKTASILDIELAGIERFDGSAPGSDEM